MKKLSKIFIALFMVLTLVTPSGVFAAEPVTITNIPANTGITLAGREFAAYKLFDIKASGTAVSYSIDEDFLDFFVAKAGVDKDLATTGTASEKAAETKKALDYVTGFKTNMQAFVKLIQSSLTSDADDKTNAVSTTTDENGVVTEEVVRFDDLANGYYLFKDNSSLDTEEDDAIVASALINSYDDAAGLNINIKGSKPSIDKDIEDNDHGFGDVADHQIGDVINFKITAKLPTNTEGYESYTYKIVDSMSRGLSFNKGSIKIEGLTLDTDYTVDSSDTTGFTVSLVDLLNNPTIKAKTEIVLTYTATLTSDAFIAGEGEVVGDDENVDYDKNDVTLIYSNNPYTDSEGKQTDTVFNYTFKADFLKTAGDGETALAGAEFTLYEADGTTPIPLSTKGDNVYYPAYNGSKLANGTGVIITDRSGKFDIVGLDDEKTYILRETKAPDGYNAAADITIRFEADYGDDKVLDKIINVTAPLTATDSGATGTIINTSATLLPETGGVGTVMFSVVGVSVMVAAAVLIIKGRKEENTDC